jgi:hypothetical protein
MILDMYRAEDIGRPVVDLFEDLHRDLSDRSLAQTNLTGWVSYGPKWSFGDIDMWISDVPIRWSDVEKSALKMFPSIDDRVRAMEEWSSHLAKIFTKVHKKVLKKAAPSFDEHIHMYEAGKIIEDQGYKGAYNEGLRYGSGQDTELVVFDGSDVEIIEQVESSVD